MTWWPNVAITMTVIVISLFTIVFTLDIIDQSNKLPCTEHINACYFTTSHFNGKTTSYSRTYVACTDLRAQDIKQVCITDAPDVALKEYWNSTQQRLLQ